MIKQKPLVIFDLDGTLVDSESLNNLAFLQLLPELNEGVEWLTSQYQGKKLSFILSDIERKLGKALPDDFEIQYRKKVADLFTTNLRPIDSVPEMLEVISPLQKGWFRY